MRAAHRLHISAKTDHQKKRRDAKNTQRRNERAVERLKQVKAPETHAPLSQNQHTFLQILTKEQVKHHYRRFYEATSRESLRHHTCAVCGRSRTQTEQKVTEVEFDKLPNSHRLAPSSTQRDIVPATELTRGLLLCRSGCHTYHHNDEIKIDVCQDCLSELSQSHINTPPKDSLANDLWTGNVPWELDILTLPERLLISLHFTRVYVIKLQPWWKASSKSKKKGGAS